MFQLILMIIVSVFKFILLYPPITLSTWSILIVLTVTVFLVFNWIILQYVENKVVVKLKQISVALRDDAALKWVLNKSVSSGKLARKLISFSLSWSSHESMCCFCHHFDNKGIKIECCTCFNPYKWFIWNFFLLYSYIIQQTGHESTQTY